jgi:hypothetical protein
MGCRTNSPILILHSLYGTVLTCIRIFPQSISNSLHYSTLTVNKSSQRTNSSSDLRRLSSPIRSPVWSTMVCQSQSQSQNSVTTDGQSASLSWNKAPIWDLRPDFYYCQTVSGLLMWGALSDERTGLSFTIAPGPCQRKHFRLRLPWDS